MKYIDILRCLGIIIFLGFFGGVVNSQSINPTDLPIVESGISAVEYNDILKYKNMSPLPTTKGLLLSKECNKTKLTNNQIHSKKELFRPGISLHILPVVPQTDVIREEDYYENK